MNSALFRLGRIVKAASPFNRLHAIDRPGERRTARILIGAAGASLAAIWIIALVALYYIRETILLDARNEFTGLSHHIQNQTKNEFTKISSFLHLVRSLDWLNVDFSVERNFEFAAYIEQFRVSMGNRAEVQMISVDGDAFPIGVPDSRPVGHVADRDFFLVQQNPASRGFYIGRPFKAGSDGRWVLPVAMPLTQTRGNIDLIVVNLDLRRTTALYEALRPKPDGSILLLAPDGTVLLHAPFDSELIAKSLADTTAWREHPPLRSFEVFQAGDLAVSSGARLAAYRRLEEFPLLVAIDKPLSEILGNWYVLVRTVLGCSAFFTLIGLILTDLLIRRIAELSHTRDALERMALTDSLTGLFNRRHFWERGQIEMARRSRVGSPLSLLMFDLDHFKSINDRFGHSAGDKALVGFAGILQVAVRQTDIAARWGGEEFVALLPDTSPSNACILAERIRTRMAETPVASDDAEFQVTVSIGIAGLSDAPADGPTLQRLVDAADQALYRAKGNGRNRCEIAAEPDCHESVAGLFEHRRP